MAPCLMRPFSAAQAGERGSFISLPQFISALEKAFRNSKIATIRLRWNSKEKMIPAARCFSLRTFVNFTSVEAAAQRQQQGFIQMFNALRRTAALGTSMAVILLATVLWRDRGLFASADRRATQRHPIPMPLGLPGPLRQRPAGRQGVAAVPAEKHVEPLFGLPGSGASRRSSGGAQSGNSPGLRPAGVRAGRLNGQAGRRDRRSATGLQSGSAKAAAGTGSQEAEQCAGSGDTKRVPQRLSAKLRRRADRGRRGIELPGKEQGEPFGELSEGGQRGRRRRGAGGRRCRAAPAAGGAPADAQQPPVPELRAPRWCCGRCGPAK